MELGLVELGEAELGEVELWGSVELGLVLLGLVLLGEVELGEALWSGEVELGLVLLGLVLLGEVELDELPSLVTLQDAMEAGSYHGARPVMVHGDIDAGFADSAHVFTGEFQFSGQEHFYL